MLGQGGEGEWWIRELERKRQKGEEAEWEYEYGMWRMYVCVLPEA